MSVNRDSTSDIASRNPSDNRKGRALAYARYGIRDLLDYQPSRRPHRRSTDRRPAVIDLTETRERQTS